MTSSPYLILTNKTTSKIISAAIIDDVNWYPYPSLMISLTFGINDGSGPGGPEGPGG